MNDPNSIPERVRAHLVQELDEAPLLAPDPAQARYHAQASGSAGRFRRLAVSGVLAAVAVLVLGIGAFAAAAPPQVVRWIDELPFAVPASTPTAEPSETPEATPTAEPVVAGPVPTEGPEAGEAGSSGGEHESGSQQPETERPATPEPSGEHESSTPAPSPSAGAHESEGGTSSTSGQD